ncbi:MAG: hypothetical protein J0J01_18445 [Reyranella sp.]|nr:hypothetical protein [Reyranella sp.]
MSPRGGQRIHSPHPWHRAVRMASSPTYPSLDLSFVRHWSPARCMAVGMVVYAVVAVTSPLEFNYSYVTWTAAVYALAIMSAFFGGCYVSTNTGPPIDTVKPLPFQASTGRYIYLTIIIAFLGILARVYDRFILRSFSVQETFAETRESLEGQVSVFGYIGGLAFSFGLIALTLVWLTKTDRRRPVATAIAMLLAAYPMTEGLLGASRSPMLHTAILVFVLARATRSLTWLVHSRVALLAVGLVLITFFQLLFEIRTLEGGGYEESIAEAFRFTGMAEFAAPPAWITNAIIATDGQGFYVAILKNLVHIEQHITHSWVVYFANFAHFDELEFGDGYIHFSLPLRVIAYITGQQIFYSPFVHGMEEGMYSASLSNIYYDFGLLGVPLAFAFGYAQTVLHRKAVHLPERWLPLHILMCFANFMTFIDNPLTGGLGAFAVWGTLLYVIIHFIVATLSRESEISELPSLPARSGAPNAGAT